MSKVCANKKVNMVTRKEDFRVMYLKRTLATYIPTCGRMVCRMLRFLCWGNYPRHLKVYQGMHKAMGEKALIHGDRNELVA